MDWEPVSMGGRSIVDIMIQQQQEENAEPSTSETRVEPEESHSDSRTSPDISSPASPPPEMSAAAMRRLNLSQERPQILISCRSTPLESQPRPIPVTVEGVKREEAEDPALGWVWEGNGLEEGFLENPYYEADARQVSSTSSFGGGDLEGRGRNGVNLREAEPLVSSSSGPTVTVRRRQQRQGQASGQNVYNEYAKTAKQELEMEDVDQERFDRQQADMRLNHQSTKESKYQPPSSSPPPSAQPEIPGLGSPQMSDPKMSPERPASPDVPQIPGLGSPPSVAENPPESPEEDDVFEDSKVQPVPDIPVEMEEMEVIELEGEEREVEKVAVKVEEEVEDEDDRNLEWGDALTGQEGDEDQKAVPLPSASASFKVPAKVTSKPTIVSLTNFENQVQKDTSSESTLSGSDAESIDPDRGVKEETSANTSSTVTDCSDTGTEENVSHCLRKGCRNQAVESPEWDNEYCSNECAVIHCKRVFKQWVAQRQAQVS